MSAKEESAGGTVAVQTEPAQNRLVLRQKGKDTLFAFDRVFGAESGQADVFQTLGSQQLDQALAGYNSTIFAYGQTGSGKTHTMMNLRAPTAAEAGLIPRMAEGLFERIAALSQQHPSRRCLVQCSILEIYNEVVHDLLAPKRKEKLGLEVKEQRGIGVYVKDLTETVAETAERLTELIEEGMAMRAVASTKMNDASSRSHCIFTIRVHQKDEEDSSQNTISKLNLVDLAGSERVRYATGEAALLKEGANINKSLSALGNVINALSSMSETGKKRAYVPYRDSKLTRVLQESLGGNSFCTMVATVSPCVSNLEETLSTLNYAKRAKAIRVTATRNDETAQKKLLEREIETLQQKIGVDTTLASQEASELEERHRQELEHLEAVLKQSWEDKQKISEQYEEQRTAAREEMSRIAERIEAERLRRLQMLEQRGDIHLTLQAIEAAGGRRRSDWPDKVASLLKVWEQLQSQLRAVAVYRHSSAVDLGALWARSDEADAEGGFRDGEVNFAVTLLGQVHNKFGLMARELDQVITLEGQIKEQIGELAPDLALALRDARADAAAARMTAVPSNGETAALEDAAEELPELIAMVQQQLQAHCAKERQRLDDEALRLLLDDDLGRFTVCLEVEGREAEEASPLLIRLRDALQAAVASEPARRRGDFPRLLGLATELPGDRIAASSNAASATAARLLNDRGLGGWCPAHDSAEEYIELDLGETAAIVGLSLQGREPCSTHWAHTHELLRLALASVQEECSFLQVPEKTLARPPVRFVHDVAMAMVDSRKCFGTGEEGWEIDDDHVQYPAMTREHKAAFFEELIRRTNQAWESRAKSLGGVGGVVANVTSADILAGKKCEETNRLLQMLCYLCLQQADNGRGGTGGLYDAAPQWVKQLRLRYLTPDGDWRWYTADGGADEASQALLLNGCFDAHGVRYVGLPRPVVATRVRLHPATWHRRPGLRCEVHLSDVAAAADEAAHSALSRCLEGTGLAGRAASVLREALEARLRKQSEHEVDFRAQAAQERGDLERRLDQAIARAEAAEARALAAEADLLTAQADIERLSANVKSWESEVAAASEAKHTAEARASARDALVKELQASNADLAERLEVMTDQRDSLRAHEEDLENKLVAKDEIIRRETEKYVAQAGHISDDQEVDQEMQMILADKITEMQELIAALEDRNDAMLDEVKKLRTDLKTAQESNKALTHERDKLARKKEKLEEKKADLIKKLEESENYRLAAKQRAQSILEKRTGQGDGTSEGASPRPPSARSSRSGRSGSDRHGGPPPQGNAAAAVAALAPRGAADAAGRVPHFGGDLGPVEEGEEFGAQAPWGKELPRNASAPEIRLRERRSSSKGASRRDR